MSENKHLSMTLQDKSNSELKTSVASNYEHYIDQFKKNMADLLKQGGNEESNGAY